MVDEAETPIVSGGRNFSGHQMVSGNGEKLIPPRIYASVVLPPSPQQHVRVRISMRLLWMQTPKDVEPRLPPA